MLASASTALRRRGPGEFLFSSAVGIALIRLWQHFPPHFVTGRFAFRVSPFRMQIEATFFMLSRQKYRNLGLPLSVISKWKTEETEQ